MRVRLRLASLKRNIFEPKRVGKEAIHGSLILSGHKRIYLGHDSGSLLNDKRPAEGDRHHIKTCPNSRREDERKPPRSYWSVKRAHTENTALQNKERVQGIILQ